MEISVIRDPGQESGKDGKLGCRGAGDSHLPRSLRARSPHVLSPVGGSTANGRGTKFREPTGTAYDHRGFRRSSRT